MIISFIFITFNSSKFIIECLNSLSKLIFPPELQIETIVLDNNSYDNTFELIENNKEQYQNINLINMRNEINMGLSKATNYAFTKSSGDYIVICNPDVIFQEDFVKFIQYGIEYCNSAIIGPNLLHYDNRGIQWGIHSRMTNLTRIFFGFGLFGPLIDNIFLNRKIRYRFTYFNQDFTNGHYLVGQIGVCHMFSKKMLFDVGDIYDENFFLYFGDVDLSLRARRRQYKSILIGDVKIKHFMGHSIITQPPLFQRYQFCKDMIKFVRKHGHLSLVRIVLFLDSVMFVAVTEILWRNRNLKHYATSQVRGILT